MDTRGPLPANKDSQQQQQQQLNRMPVLDVSGTVEAVRNGRNQGRFGREPIVDPSGSTRRKSANSPARATRDALGAGLFVRFSGEVDKRHGTIEEPLTKLTVFTPSQFLQPGVEPDAGFGTDFGQRAAAGKGKKMEAQPKSTFGADGGASGAPARANGRKSADAAGKNAPATEKFDIRGKIASISDGRILVQLPANAFFRTMIRADIAEDAEIDVEIADPLAYTWARKGDKAHIQGRQGMGNLGYATNVEITLTSPLGAAKDAKKTRAKGDKKAAGVSPDTQDPATETDTPPTKKAKKSPTRKRPQPTTTDNDSEPVQGEGK